MALRDEDNPISTMATFQLFQSSGQHWYRLRADSGGIVQSGAGDTSTAACENGIQSVRANCQPQRSGLFLNAGQYGFNRVATNGEIIGRSEKYTAAQARGHGLQVVVREVSEAQVQDLSQ